MGITEMKIAITGHSAGIGQALSKEYANLGHEVIGLSRRNGYNIKSTPKVCDAIQPCDVFINNAQSGFAQTELLIEMTKRWTGQNKSIIVVSTMMTEYPSSVLPGIEMDEYYIQKCTLENTVKQLRAKHKSINYTIVRPGNIATSPNKTVPPAADVDHWASSLVKILTTANLFVSEISLGPARGQ